MLWLTASALMAALLMIGALIGWILFRGLPAFWPGPLAELRTADGRVRLGETLRTETIRLGPEARDALPPDLAARLPAGETSRRLVRTGSFDRDGVAHAWIADVELVAPPRYPADAVVVERVSRDRCHGYVAGYAVRATAVAARPDGADGTPAVGQALEEMIAAGPPDVSGAQPAVRLADGVLDRGARRWIPASELAPDQSAVAVGWLWLDAVEAFAAYQRLHRRAVDAARRAASLRERTVGRIDDELERIRLAERELELEHDPPIEWLRARAAWVEASVAAAGGDGNADVAARRQRLERSAWRPDPRLQGELDAIHARRLDAHRRLADAARRVAEIEARAARHALLVEPPGAGEVFEIEAADIVRAWQPNRLDLVDRLGLWAGRWWEFVSDPPRQANTAGGVFPAIFGTVLMTLLMCIVVLPFGVFAALYLHEYARPGPVVSAIRIAVNNLAGVPGIVFGVFGLGFFCYIVGSSIDDLLFRTRLPEPTFGKGGILWASLTLALLTVPVVIVATEEALAAVPNSMRHGSYACGAGRWQTVRRIVLPRALPGIMTGAILAMARGAGEVAPLMLVGAVKYVPDLPLDAEPPFGLDRSFMHLGFHMLDQGFQSRNSTAAEPVVYSTAIVLLCIVGSLNLTAVWMRGRFRRRFVTGGF